MDYEERTVLTPEFLVWIPLLALLYYAIQDLAKRIYHNWGPPLLTKRQSFWWAFAFVCATVAYIVWLEPGRGWHL